MIHVLQNFTLQISTSVLLGQIKSLEIALADAELAGITNDDKIFSFGKKSLQSLYKKNEIQICPQHVRKI